MIINRNFFTLIGVIVGIVIIFTGLLSKNNDDPNTIVINNNILKSFYLSNRNLEDPVFIKFDNLNNNQILLLKEEFIKKEVLKKEALTWGLDKVDPLILNRLAQLGEQTIVNNFLESDFSNDDLVSFYNRNKYLYIEEAKITFTHIFFRKDKIKIFEQLKLFSKNQDQIFFNNNLSSKVSMFPYQKNYSQKTYSFITGHFGESTTNNIFLLSPSDDWQGPIESPYGYHLLKISFLSDEVQKTFEEVKNLVKDRVITQKQKDNLKLELEKKISQYKIIER